MTPTEVYFLRNRGDWHWHADFRVLSWRGFAAAPIPLFYKAGFLFLALKSKIVGPFMMKTRVEYEGGPAVVRHRTSLRFLGFELYRSEKEFKPALDGVTLVLSGNEFFWPSLKRGIPFLPSQGQVDPGAVSAQYGMPLMGQTVPCKVVMSQDEGSMRLASSWLSCRMDLAPSSLVVLRSRFPKGGPHLLAGFTSPA